ncbi:MAG: EcsC family protein [Nocardioidaceae bacterium]
MGIGKTIGKATAAAASAKIAPEYTSGFVRSVLDRAIDGVGRLPGARASADKRLAESDGDVDKAIHEIIESHVRLAGVQGFVTNLGGVVTLAVTIPANITGLALLQCHLVATIAHLRGYDIDDHRVRNAILACMMGEETVEALIKDNKIPSTPAGIATAPYHDEELDKRVGRIVTTELIAKVGGKRVVTAVGRRVPLVGGAIGGAADGFNTWRVGRYADKALPNRRP